MTRALLACSATASAAWIIPFTIPGGNPVTAAAGWIPRSPVMVVAPVLVTAGVPAKTAKGAAVPSPTGAGPAAFAVRPTASMPIARGTAMPAESRTLASRARPLEDARRRPVHQADGAIWAHRLHPHALAARRRLPEPDPAGSRRSCLQVRPSAAPRHQTVRLPIDPVGGILPLESPLHGAPPWPTSRPSRPAAALSSPSPRQEKRYASVAS